MHYRLLVSYTSERLAATSTLTAHRRTPPIRSTRSELPRKESAKLQKQALLRLRRTQRHVKMTFQAQTFNGAKQILLLHGPNLNLLGYREPEKYGTETLASIEERAAAQAASYGASLSALQSNHEGVVIDRIHEARTDGSESVVLLETRSRKADCLTCSPQLIASLLTLEPGLILVSLFVMLC